MNKILVSLITVGIVGGLAFGATRAFFSDKETSTGNTFEAGNIDLQVANSSVVSDGVVSGGVDFGLADNTGVMFDFSNIMPGDYGVNVISLNSVGNDAWMCGSMGYEDVENGRTDTEVALGDNPTDGELGNYLQLFWWADDNDNGIYDNSEQVMYGGPHTLAEYFSNPLDSNGRLPLTIADSQWDSFLNSSPGTAIPADTVKNIGVGWCLGTITAPGGLGPYGFDCDGSSVEDYAETDKIQNGILEFTAEQAENNPTFLCPEHL